jgi:hypothetical protein
MNLHATSSALPPAPSDLNVVSDRLQAVVTAQREREEAQRQTERRVLVEKKAELEPIRQQALLALADREELTARHGPFVKQLQVLDVHALRVARPTSPLLAQLDRAIGDTVQLFFKHADAARAHPASHRCVELG